MFFLYGMISVEAVSVNRKPAVHKSGYYAIRHELLCYTERVTILYSASCCFLTDFSCVYGACIH